MSLETCVQEHLNFKVKVQYWFKIIKEGRAKKEKNKDLDKIKKKYAHRNN